MLSCLYLLIKKQKWCYYLWERERELKKKKREISTTNYASSQINMDLDTYSFIDQKQVSFHLILPILTCEMEEMGKKNQFWWDHLHKLFQKKLIRRKKILDSNVPKKWPSSVSEAPFQWWWTVRCNMTANWHKTTIKTCFIFFFFSL